MMLRHMLMLMVVVLALAGSLLLASGADAGSQWRGPLVHPAGHGWCVGAVRVAGPAC